jgi:hypothetical protein
MTTQPIWHAAADFAARTGPDAGLAENSGRSSAILARLRCSPPCSSEASTASARATAAGGSPASFATWMP